MFQQFALRLGLHGTGLKEKTVESNVGVKKIKEKIMNERKEMALHLVKIGAALVNCAQPVVKACGALVIACGGQLMKERKKKSQNFEPFVFQAENNTQLDQQVVTKDHKQPTEEQQLLEEVAVKKEGVRNQVSLNGGILKCLNKHPK